MPKKYEKFQDIDFSKNLKNLIFGPFRPRQQKTRIFSKNPENQSIIGQTGKRTEGIS